MKKMNSIWDEYIKIELIGLGLFSNIYIYPKIEKQMNMLR